MSIYSRSRLRRKRYGTFKPVHGGEFVCNIDTQIFRPNKPERQPQVVESLSHLQIVKITQALEEEIVRTGASYDGAACGSEIDGTFFHRLRKIKSRYRDP